jgi:hypothetical protein
MSSYLLNNGVDAEKFFESAIKCCNETMQLLLDSHELKSFYLENIKDYYKRLEMFLFLRVITVDHWRSLKKEEQEDLWINILFSNAKSPSINLDDIYSIATNTTLVEYSSNVEFYYNSGELKSVHVLYIWVARCNEIRFQRVILDDLKCIKDSNMTLQELALQVRNRYRRNRIKSNNSNFQFEDNERIGEGMTSKAEDSENEVLLDENEDISLFIYEIGIS